MKMLILQQTNYDRQDKKEGLQQDPDEPGKRVFRTYQEEKEQDGQNPR